MTNPKGLPEIFLIAQQHKEDMFEEEKGIAIDMAIKDVNFETGSGIYKNRDDAIKVAKKLIDNKPERKLAVISAVG